MIDYPTFNRRVNEKYFRLGADKLRIERLIEKEELPENTAYRLAELQKDIDVAMTGGWG